MNNKKPIVFTLICLLTFTGTLSLLNPTQAETWTDIPLPYTITQSGNYRISGAFNVTGTALSINASNVVVDGQNHLISLNQSEGDTAIAIAKNSKNVLLKNINATGADYGVYSREGNFTLTDSLFTNNTSTGVFAFNATGFTVQNSRTSESAYGIVAIDCSNFLINDCHIKNNLKGIVAVLSSGLSIQGTHFNGNGEAVSVQNCTNVKIDSSMLVENEAAINATYTTLSAFNVNASNNIVFAFYLSNSTFKAANCTCTNNAAGLYAMFSNYTITNSSFSNNLLAGAYSGYSNGTLLHCAVENNTYGEFSVMNNATIIDDCSVKNNEYGLVILASQTMIVKDSLFFNNTLAGLWDQQSSSSILSRNNFTQNGFSNESQEYGGGALFQVESNSTVTDNTFKNNYEALLIGGFEDETINTIVYNYNKFENNSYTFDFNYNLPSNSSNLEIHFYNNYVNDTAYISPLSFINEGMTVPSANVLFLNTTLQAGKRVTLDGARMIGGNYWAHPNGTGFSQTAADTNTDGFADDAFDLFGDGTVYDYLPYTSSYVEKVAALEITPQTPIVKAGEPVTFGATAYDEYGNAWNATASYTIEGNEFNGTITAYSVGAYYVEATYGGKSANTTLTIVPNEVDRYVILTPNSAKANMSFTIRILAVDAYNNIVTDYSGKVTLSLNATNISPRETGDFTYGSWMGTVTITDTGTFTITAKDSNGKTGTSNALTIEQETAIPTTPPPPPSTDSVQATKEDGTKVTLSLDGNITSSQITNMTITTNQTDRTTMISFTITGPAGGNGFCNITIAKSSIAFGSIPIVLIDGQTVANQGFTEDNQNFYVWFTTSFSTHRVEIQFNERTQPTSPPTENDSNWWVTPVALIVGLAIVSVALVFVFSRRTRLHR